MVIEITEEQRQVLRDLIDTRLSYLSSEIRHTDSATMREGLRTERETLRGLAGTLSVGEPVDA